MRAVSVSGLLPTDPGHLWWSTRPAVDCSTCVSPVEIDTYIFLVKSQNMYIYRWAIYLEILLLLRTAFIFFAIYNAFLTTSAIIHLVSGQPSDANPTNVMIFLHLVQLASCAYFHLHPEELFR